MVAKWKSWRKIWSLIDANISYQLPKSQKTACEANWNVFSQKRNAGMLLRQPRKCLCAIPADTIPLRSLDITASANARNSVSSDKLQTQTSRICIACDINKHHGKCLQNKYPKIRNRSLLLAAYGYDN